MIDDNQIYVVVDIEADGPVPGLHSMLSIGAVATTARAEVAQFYRTILPIDGAAADPDTAAWWQAQPEAWAEVIKDAQPADAVMRDFCAWMSGLGKDPVFVAHPIALDYTFVSWYLCKFIGQDPFLDGRHYPRTLDLRSYAAGKLGVTLDNAHRNRLPAHLTAGMPDHNHIALDDAVGYGVILRNILEV